MSLSFLSLSPLLHSFVCLTLTGDMDYNRLDHTSWHSSEASPMSLVIHVEPYYLIYVIISVFLFDLHLCMFSFLFPIFFFFILFFYPTPVGDSQKGKRKTSEQAVLSDSNTRSGRQKKMMYFGGHSLEEDLEWSEPQIKDSGVDTCSSTTLNEEHSHSDKVLRLWSLPFNLLIWSSFALCHSFKGNIIKGQDISRVNVAFLKVQKRKTKQNQTNQPKYFLLACCFCCLTAYPKISK